MHNLKKQKRFEKFKRSLEKDQQYWFWKIKVDQKNRDFIQKRKFRKREKRYFKIKR